MSDESAHKTAWLKRGETTHTVSVPVRWHKGRGAVSNPQGRFEKLSRQADPDFPAESAETDWAHGDGSEDSGPQTTVQRERAASIIARNQSADIFFDQSINPYRGCEHGCIYCYARPQHSYIGLSPGKDFETRLFAKVNAPELLRSELSARSYRCSPINVGSVTDAYQPIERHWQITRRLIEVLVESRHPFSVITKSSLIERDIDLLAKAAEQKLVAAYITVTTLDPAMASHWEPRAAAPWRRIATIRRLTEAGVPVGVMVAPIVPFLNEPEIESILAQAAKAGARSAHYTVLRLPHELKDVFADWLQHHYPDRARRVIARIVDLRGGSGRLNDANFFTRMKGTGAWAELIRLRFEMATHKYGLDRGRFSLRSDLFRPPVQGQFELFD